MARTAAMMSGCGHDEDGQSSNGLLNATALDMCLAEASRTVEKLRSECAALDVSALQHVHDGTSAKEQISPSRPQMSFGENPTKATRVARGTRTETPRRAGEMMAGLDYKHTSQSPLTMTVAVPSRPHATDKNDDVLARVDAYRLNRRRAEWPSVNDVLLGTKPRGPASRLDAVKASRSTHQATTKWARELAPQMAIATCDTSSMSRAERIKFLENLEHDKAVYAEVVPRKGRRMTAARAHCERSLRGTHPLKTVGCNVLATSMPHKSLQGTNDYDEAPPADDSMVMQASLMPEKMPYAVDAPRVGDGIATQRNNDEPIELNRSDGHADAENLESKRTTSRKQLQSLESDDKLMLPNRRSAKLREESRRERPTVNCTASNTAKCLSELKRLTSAGCADLSQIRRLSDALEARAYTMNGNDALDAMERITEAISKIDLARCEINIEHPIETHKTNMFGESTAMAIRNSLHKMMGSISIRIIEHKASFVADALMAMATTRSGRQEFLDAMLAHVFMLLWHEPHSFTPPVMARIMGALGLMRAKGGVDDCTMCARAGANAERCVSNQKFLQMFNSHFLDVIPAFLENDIGAVHETFLVAYLEENALNRFFYRAAQLQVGLLPMSAQHLHTLQRALSAVSQELPTFVAMLQPFTRQYCERL